MKQKQYSKRDFLKLAGMGSLGFLFWQCYDTKKESQNSVYSENNLAEEPSKSETPKPNYTDKDVVFFTLNDEKYNELRKGFNKRFDQFPKIIALCFTTIGVQASVLKAKEEQLKISIKSGGHSFEAFSCTQDSLLINLSQMNKIKWVDNESVILQPATLLQEIYANFLPKKRIIPAGSCGTVAVAGLTLGGGYGFFSRKYGLTCDNLTRVKLIDGNGEEQDSLENPELLWACRGGGNGNFGVVTEMHFHTYPAPNTFSSYRLKFRNLTSERFLQIAELWFSITKNIPLEAFSAFVLNGKTLTILFTRYLTHNSEFETIFSSLKSLADEYKPTYNQPIAKALKRYYGRKKPLYFKNASAGLYKGFDEIRELLPIVFDKVIQNSGMIYQINTLGGEISNTEFEKAAAYPHRKYDYLSELQSYWESPSQEKKLLSGFEEIQTIFHEAGISTQYRNYPDINFQNWETAYYGSNYKRLQKIKTELDPDDLFHYAQSIRPIEKNTSNF
ncbi:MAG: FAD-binding protein [Moheibacter sp.]